MTKDISMKKLNKWAEEWCAKYYKKDNDSDVFGTPEFSIVNSFLRYVSEHRND